MTKVHITVYLKDGEDTLFQAAGEIELPEDLKELHAGNLIDTSQRLIANIMEELKKVLDKSTKFR